MATKVSFFPKQNFFNSIDWIDTHRSELREKYQGKWIAVFNRRIVASGRKIQNVQKKATAITSRALDEIPIVYIEDSHCIY